MPSCSLPADTGEPAHFTGRFFREGFWPRFEVCECVHQCYVIGYQLLPLTDMAALQHHFLLRGYFRKQARQQARAAGSGAAPLSAGPAWGQRQFCGRRGTWHYYLGCAGCYGSGQG